jgi:hypothetical protein
MIWLTWRQHRYEALVALILLVIVLFVLVGSGLNIIDVAKDPEQALFGPLIDSYIQSIFVPFNLLPLILGMFVGAPLVARELEEGTYRLVWTQRATPFQWLRTKLALLSAATLLAFGIVFVALIWWNRPVNEMLGPWRTFEAQGPVILAYAFLGLALGVAVGAVVGKTIPAMALTIPLYLLIREGVRWLRPEYLPPLKSIWDFGGDDPRLWDWVLSSRYIGPTGQLFSIETRFAAVGKGRSPTLVIEPCGHIVEQARVMTQEVLKALHTCYHDNGIVVEQTFQPLNRFWLFQGIETILLITLSAGLIALAFWWVRRRIRN